MEIKRIEELKPATYNPRKIDEKELKKLVRSIEEFGFVEPVVINKDLSIIGGHQRVKAAKELGFVEVPVVEVNLPKGKEKALNLALNRISGEFDEDLLSRLLEELDDEDRELSGFDTKEVEKALNAAMTVEEDDYDGEPPKEPKSQYGQVYALGEHRLMCGDATKKEDVEKLMDGEKADMVFTDPPYGIDVVKDGKVGADFGIAKKGEYSDVIGDNTTDTAKDFYITCKELGFDRYIIWGGNYFTDFLPFSDGWIVWDKRGDSGIRNTFADGEMASCSFHTPVRIYKQLWNGMIREGEKDKRLHPTQKPIQTLGAILSDFTKEQEVVLDPFGGSGSTLIACEQTNRKCYMMELDPKYVDVIIDRWETFTGNKAELLN